MEAAEVFGVVCLVPDCWRCVLSHRNSASAPHNAVCVYVLPLGQSYVWCAVCVSVEKVCVCVSPSVPSRRMTINHSCNPPWRTFSRSLWLQADILCVIFNLSPSPLLLNYLSFHFELCLWPSSPTPGCPIFLIAAFCHGNSAQRWVTPLCQLGNLHPAHLIAGPDQ